MGLIIDTSILISLEKNRINHNELLNFGSSYINPIILTELLTGADRANNENRRVKRLAFIEYVKKYICCITFQY